MGVSEIFMFCSFKLKRFSAFIIFTSLGCRSSKCFFTLWLAARDSLRVLIPPQITDTLCGHNASCSCILACGHIALCSSTSHTFCAFSFEGFIDTWNTVQTQTKRGAELTFTTF